MRHFVKNHHYHKGTFNATDRTDTFNTPNHADTGSVLSSNFSTQVFTTKGWLALMSGLLLFGIASCGKVSSLDQVVTVTVSRSNTCVLIPLKGAKCWGKNNLFQINASDGSQHIGDQSGEMGSNLAYLHLDSYALQVMAGYQSVCVISVTGVLKCWGNNEQGKLGQAHSNVYVKAPVKGGTSIPVTNLGGKVFRLLHSDNNTCAMLLTGMVKCWGDNRYGQLGQGDTNNRGDVAAEMGTALTALPVSTGTAITAGGFEHLCALLSTGAVKCWGRNTYGQLGQGNTTSIGDTAPAGGTYPTVNLGQGQQAKKLALGKYHSCALLQSAKIKCWGRNTYGQLGLGDVNDRGDDANEMGDNLLAANLGTNAIAIDVAVGHNHTCALLRDQSVKCWGKNTVGPLGVGDTSHRGTSASQMGDSLAAVSLGTEKPVGIAAGGYMSCAIFPKNKLKCWGDNSYGRLGLGDVNDRGDQAGEMGDNLPFIDIGL